MPKYQEFIDKMLSYEDIVENLAEGVIAIDLETKVKVFNQAAEKTFEVSRSMVTGRPLKELFHRNRRLTEMLENTLKQGRLFSEYEEKVHRRFSGTLPVGITTSQTFDNDGNLNGAVALIKDLSGIKSLEAGSLRKERLAYIGTFAANLAHEIKNPLSGIKGAAQLLARRIGAENENLNEYINVIIKEAERLNITVNEMLDFARPAKLNKKEINIHKVLDSVILLLKEGAGQVVFLKGYDPSLPPVYGDENQLTQVFLNLVKNAREALSGNGTIQINTRMIMDFHIVEEGSQGGKMVGVEIKDTGCGIRPEDMEKIFTPFFTTKPRGSGLGMAISLKIIKEHGGLLKIDSAPGKGTRVEVGLPVKG